MHPFSALPRDARVDIRGQRWRVLATTAHDDCQACHTTGVGGSNHGLERTFLLPFDRVHPLEQARTMRAVRARTWWRTVRWHLSGARPFGGLDVLTTAAVDLLPYQLEPALAMFRHGRLRLLLADAVGLGKTIQAAVTITHLRVDDPDARVLIVCPAGLRRQWETELRSRFGIAPVLCDAEWLAGYGRTLPPGANPWSLPGVHVASIDLVKRPEVLRMLDEVTWDLGVFDEAHLLAPSTDRLAAARSLAARMRRLLMLTATPPDADPASMRALASLGCTASQDELTVFRRSRHDVGIDRPRRTTFRGIEPTGAERSMHRRLDRYAALLWRSATERDDAAARLLTILLKKRALSSAGSLLASIDRRLSLLGSKQPRPSQPRFPFGDEDHLEDDEDLDLLGARGLGDVAEEQRLLAGLKVATTAAAVAESKVGFLQRLLTRSRESAIVFTEYRDTLARLDDALESHAPLVMHGGMSPADRDGVQRRFCRQGGLLLATDAASEGLNLHSQCRLVVHFEVPWNPVRLEQRVGRVDRLGQGRRVHEILLVARHTAERTVLGPLVRKLRAAADAAGSTAHHRLTESDVADIVLGEMPAIAPAADPHRDPREVRYTDEARREVTRLTVVRSRPVRESRRDESTVVTNNGHGFDTCAAIVRVQARDCADRIAGCCLLPLLIHRGRLGRLGRLGRREHAATDASALLEAADELIRAHGDAAARLVREHLLTVTPPWAGWEAQRAALLQRELELKALALGRHPDLVQAGLFDRRALRDAETERRSRDQLERDAERRIAALGADRLEVDTEIVAIHFGRWRER